MKSSIYHIVYFYLKVIIFFCLHCVNAKSQDTLSYTRNNSGIKEFHLLADQSLLIRQEVGSDTSFTKQLLLHIDSSLQSIDSISFDSLSKFSTVLPDPGGNFYLISAKYTSGTEAKLIVYKITSSLTIINTGEFSVANHAIEPFNACLKNDSILVFCNYSTTSDFVFRNFIIPPDLSILDSSHCEYSNPIPGQFLHGTSAFPNDSTIIYSGFNSGIFEPIYYIQSGENNCSTSQPFSVWESYFQSNGNLSLAGRNIVQVIAIGENLYFPIGGEDNLNLRSKAGILKTRSDLDPLLALSIAPSSLQQDFSPLRYTPINQFDGKIILCYLSRFSSMTSSPSSSNEIYISVTDTSLSPFASFSLDPFPQQTRPYYASHSVVNSTGSLFIAGSFVRGSPSDPSISFVIKINSVLNSLSTSELTSTNRLISVFPNPAGSNVHISGILPEEKVMIRLFDFQGRDLEKKEISSNTTLDLENLSSGIYYLEVRFHDGLQQVVKLIKQ